MANWTMFNLGDPKSGSTRTRSGLGCAFLTECCLFTSRMASIASMPLAAFTQNAAEILVAHVPVRQHIFPKKMGFWMKKMARISGDNLQWACCSEWCIRSTAYSFRTQIEWFKSKDSKLENAIENTPLNTRPVFTNSQRVWLPAKFFQIFLFLELLLEAKDSKEILLQIFRCRGSSMIYFCSRLVNLFLLITQVLHWIFHLERPPKP